MLTLTSIRILTPADNPRYHRHDRHNDSYQSYRCYSPVAMDAADSCSEENAKPRSSTPRSDKCRVQGQSSTSSSTLSSPPPSRPTLSFGINQILGRNSETKDYDDPAERDNRDPEHDLLVHYPPTVDLSYNHLSTHVTQPSASPSSSSSTPSTSDDHLLSHPNSGSSSDTTSLRTLPVHPPALPVPPPTEAPSRFFYRPLRVLMDRGGPDVFCSLHHRSQQVSAAAAAAAAAMFPWMFERKDRITVARRVGHPYQNRTPPKRKKPRTSFTRLQVLELEKRFHRQKYLASAERSSLAKTLSMSDAQVKTWFQNRRTKWRRQTAEEREAERQAANRLLLSLHPSAAIDSSSSSYSPSPSHRSRSLYSSPPDALCMNNASLQALHNLQPWADDYPSPPHDLPQQGTTTNRIWTSTGCSSTPPPTARHHRHPLSIPHHQLLLHHRTPHPPTIAAAAAAYLSNISSPIL